MTGAHERTYVTDPRHGCVFCQIVVGEAPAKIVARGNGWTIFRPLNPHAPGHVLVVPNRHVESAVAAPRVAGIVMAAAARYLGAVGPQGNILASSGPAATQTVFHLHVHVIPRGENDNLPADWPWMRDGEA